MAKQKFAIPHEKLDEASRMLQVLAKSASDSADALRAGGKDAFPIDGWPTLVTSMVRIQDQLKKFASPVAPVHDIDPKQLLLEGQSIDNSFGGRKAPLSAKEGLSKLKKTTKKVRKNMQE